VLGLNRSLEGLCRDFAGRTGLEIAYQGQELPTLSDAVAITCYRFMQETLANVARHAQASKVSVTLQQSDGEVVLSVADDGVGFEQGSLWRAGGVGLIGLKERLESAGGALEIESAPGRGARVTGRARIA
jgi:signal transduction histidine kinase